MSLASAISGLATTLAATDGVTIIYSDGTDTAVLTAVVGQTQFELDDGNGLLEVAESRDYLFQAADLELNDVVVEPSRGHTITEVIGGTSMVFEVMALAGEGCFRYSDVGRTRIRCHTKLTDDGS